MILLDTSIIIDLLSSADNEHADWSRRTYGRSLDTALLGCNHIILAEVVAGAAHPAELADDLDRLQIEILPLSIDAALAAARSFGDYRRRGGGKATILPDFLIGGHAVALGAALMTRDRGLATYFPELSLMTPETHP